MKDYSQDWEVIGDLGKGGQGDVKLVKKRFGKGLSRGKIYINNIIGDSVSVLLGVEEIARKLNLNDYVTQEQVEAIGKLFFNMISDVASTNYGALKMIKKPYRNVFAPERMAREIDVCNRFSHPNLIKIIAFDDEDRKWYICPFYESKSLEDALIFTGNVRDTLLYIRPIIDAVKMLHLNDTVHRDVKPANIFIADDGQLILADPGLALSKDAERNTTTKEVVASWDWAPIWVQDGKMSDIDRTHDVYCIVKVIWAMIAGALSYVNPQKLMQLWYWDRPKYDLRNLFPNQIKDMEIVSDIFRKVIVENREDCLIEDCGELLIEVDRALEKLDRNRRISILGGSNYSPIFLRDKELKNHFEIITSDSVFSNKEGFLCTGNEKFSESKVGLKNPINLPFTIRMSVDSTKFEGDNPYWRAGFRIRGSDNKQEITCHIDNHNMIVAYIDDANVLYVPSLIDFNETIASLQLNLSYTIKTYQKRLYFNVNNANYYIGELNTREDELFLSLEVWSDHMKNHKVILNDISLFTPSGITLGEKEHPK